jgi:hypothetical protein
MVSDEAYNMFTNSETMNFVMKNSFDSDSYCEAICHLSFNNKKLSKQYSKYLL